MKDFLFQVPIEPAGIQTNGYIELNGWLLDTLTSCLLSPSIQYALG